MAFSDLELMEFKFLVLCEARMSESSLNPVNPTSLKLLKP